MFDSGPMAIHHHLAAVWFADIVDYSGLSAEDESRALAVVRLFQRVAEEAAERYGGRIVKFLGDAALAEFPSTQAAVGAADALVEAFPGRAAGAGLGGRALRIGVHVGDVAITEDGDLYGDGVNGAARLYAEADAGQIVVSEDVHRQLRHRPEFEFEALGQRSFKGVGRLGVFAVRVVGEVPPEATRGEAAPVGEGRRRSRVAIAGLAAAALIAVALLARAGGEDPAPDPDPASGLDPSRLAVLYLDDHSPGRDLGHVADGFTEAIIHELTQVEALDVVSRHGVKPFRDGAAALDSVARALDVGTLIEGSVARSGDRLRVTVQLIDARDMAHVASITEERPWGELFALQDEVVSELTSVLRQRLGREIRLEERREETESVEAWELVGRAERLAEQARAAEDDPVSADLRAEADRLLERAEALDPRWAAPTLLRARLARDEGAEEALGRALEHVRRALAARPGDPAALALRGELRYRLAEAAADSVAAAGHLAAAEGDLRAAVAAEPSRAAAWITLADLLYNAKWELAAARAAAMRGWEQDAFLLESDHFVWLCEISLQLEEYDEATRWCQEGGRRFPDRARIPMTELYILASEGVEPDTAAARRRLEAIGRLPYAEYNVPPARLLTAVVLARAGALDRARSAARAARSAARPEVEPYMEYLGAYLALRLGARAEALDRLERFLAALPGERATVARDHWFEDLAGDPRFEALVDRTRLPLFCRIVCRAP